MLFLARPLLDARPLAFSKARQSKAEQSKAKESKAHLRKAKQSKAKHSMKAEESKAKQRKAKQRKAEQNKASSFQLSVAMTEHTCTSSLVRSFTQGRLIFFAHPSALSVPVQAQVTESALAALKFLILPSGDTKMINVRASCDQQLIKIEQHLSFICTSLLF